MNVIEMGMLGGFGLAVFAGVSIFLALCFRTVVPTNDVHIVQSVRRTTPYGKGELAGNVYYQWPSWVPFIGVRNLVLPMSVFDQGLSGYAAYDKDRVPFVVDIIAFFRISDPGVAAQR